MPSKGKEKGDAASRKGSKAQGAKAHGSVGPASAVVKRRRARRPEDSTVVTTKTNKRNVPGKMGPSRVRSDAPPPSWKWYSKSLMDPFGVRAVKSPCIGNIAPTVKSFTATTTGKVQGSTAINSSTTFFFYGGHGANLNTSGPTASAATGLTVNGTNYIVGPAGSTTGLDPCVGHYSTILDNSVSPVEACMKYATNTSDSKPLTYTKDLPFTVSISDSTHSRWRLVSMGIKFVNTSSGLNRGGELTVCQPDVNFIGAAFEPVSSLAQFSHYKLYDADDPVTISWVPKSLDLGYWSSFATVATDYNGAALFVNFHNFGDASNNWTIDYVCNWEYAGTNVSTVTEYSPTDPVSTAAAQHVSGVLLSVPPPRVSTVENLMAAAHGHAAGITGAAEKMASIVGGIGAAMGAFVH